MGERALRGGLQTVATALDLLDCFAEDEELGVTEVSRRMGIPKSSAHRLLTTLASRGILEQSPHNAKYRLGLHLYELGNLAGSRVLLRRSAQGPLEELRETVGWTVQLSVASGVDALVLERLQTVRSIHALPDFHRRLPLHVTAQGKAMCAFNPELANARLAAGLPRSTPRSIVTRAAFLRTLDETRRNGFATVDGEAVLEVAAIGVPILDHRGIATAGLSIIGPAEGLLPSSARIGRLAQTTARRIAKGLRYGLDANA